MAKPKPNKYSRARVRSRVRRPKQGSSRGWAIATIAIVAVFSVLLIVTYQDHHEAGSQPPEANKDHWHAYLGVNVCGTWEPAVPAFENRDGTNTSGGIRAGIHSHGDYLIHDHPFASDESGKSATLGRYLGYAQSEVSTDTLKLWSLWAPDVNEQNGDKCDGKAGKVQWKVGRLGEPWPSEPRSGNPADYHMQNGDIIAIYFLPEGAALDQPPDSDQALHNIEDLGGQSAVPGASLPSTPAPDAPADSTPAPSDTSAESTPSTTAGGASPSP